MFFPEVMKAVFAIFFFINFMGVYSSDFLSDLSVESVKKVMDRLQKEGNFLE